MLYGDEHVQRYRETGGAEGHDWNGTQVLLLSTTGRKSGAERTSALIYGEHDGDRVIVASKGGADEHPAWYLNLTENPAVTVQVRDDVYPAVARTATPEERAAMWPVMVKEWPSYDEYQASTEREIPLVVLERQSNG